MACSQFYVVKKNVAIFVQNLPVQVVKSENTYLTDLNVIACFESIEMQPAFKSSTHLEIQAISKSSFWNYICLLNLY